MMSSVARLSLRGMQRIDTPFLGSLSQLHSGIQIREKSDFSVYDAFKKGLHLRDLVKDGDRPTGSTGQGGAYTIATNPPKVWAPWDLDGKIRKAAEFVEEKKDQLDDVSAIEVTGLTSIDANSSEQDIIKLFSLFVMYPVEVALLQIKLPESWRLNLRCEVHPTEGREVRVDMMLEARSSSDPDAVKTLAVMEMKNFGVIEDEMGNVMAAGVTSVNEAEIVGQGPKNLFKDDSKLLLRQSAAYAARFKTRHVALCDGSVALYLDFAQLLEALEMTTGTRGGFAGDYVLLYAQTEASTFHYALLAFFKGAVDEWLLGFAEKV